MPALSIYDTEGNRLGGDTQSERVRQFASNGGRLTLDTTGETARVLALFVARDPESESTEQYYAVYQGSPQSLHPGLRQRLRETHGLELSRDQSDTVYELLVPGVSTQTPGDTEQLDSVAELLTDDESGVSQVGLGAETYQDARRVVQYLLGQGYTATAAVADSATSPELSGFDLVVEQGDYEGVEPLPQTERQLDQRQSTAPVGSGESEHSGRTDTTGDETEESEDGEGSKRSESAEEGTETGRQTVVLLGAFGLLALFLLVVGAALGGGIPFVGGGEASPALELDSAEIRGTDGVVVDGRLENQAVGATSFTLRVWAGEPGDGEPVVTTQTGATSNGDGTFTLGVDAERIDAATDGFAYRGDTDYRVEVETDQGATATATLERGAVDLALADIQWSADSLTVTGSLTQGGAPVHGRPDLDVTLGDGETVSPGVTYESNGTVTLSLPDGDTDRDLSGGGEVTVTVALGDTTDSIAAQREPSTEPAVFEVTLEEVTSPVTAGEGVSLTAEIANTGETEATQTVDLDAGALGDDSSAVTLTPGETATRTLTVDTGDGDAGSYTLEVSSNNATDSTTVTVQRDEPQPRFSVAVSETNAPVSAGQSLAVTTSITNTGEAAGTQSLVLQTQTFGNDTVTLMLSPGETATETLTVQTSLDDAGEFTVGVRSDDDADTAVVTVEGEGEGEGNNGDGDDGEGPVDGSLEVAVDGTNAPVSVGETLTVAVAVTNTAGGELTGTLGVDAEGLGTASATLTLADGETTTRTFTFETGSGDAGLYSLTATSNGSSDSTLVTVNEEAAAQSLFEVTVLETATPVEGEELQVTVGIENAGDAGGTQTVTVSTEPTLGSATVDVSLGPGASTEETLSIPTGTGTAGEYEVTATSDDDTDTADVTVQEAVEASLQVGITGTNAPVTGGESLEVTVEVTNTGDTGGSQTVELSVGPLGSDSVEVSLGADASVTETLTVGTRASDAGEYTATVSSDDDQATEAVTVEAGPADPKVSGLDIAGQGDSASIKQGSVASATVDVTNAGGEPPESPVEVTVEVFAATATETAAPGPGETETVSVDLPTESLPAGEYEVTASTDDSSVTGSLTVEIPVDLSSLDIAGQDGSATVTQGDSAAVSVDVLNTGSVSRSFDVTLEISGPDGTVVDRTESTNEIVAGSGFVLTFESVTGDISAGEYSVTLSTVDYGRDITAEGSLTVEETGVRAAAAAALAAH